MRWLSSGLVMAGAAAILSGCYYDPGYSYVRSNGYGGDAYYGQRTVVYQGGYDVTPGYGYDGGYYGGGYYGYAPAVSVGISRGWYDGSRYDGAGRYRHDGGRGDDHRRYDMRRQHGQPPAQGRDRGGHDQGGHDQGGGRAQRGGGYQGGHPAQGGRSADGRANHGGHDRDRHP